MKKFNIFLFSAVTLSLIFSLSPAYAVTSPNVSTEAPGYDSVTSFAQELPALSSLDESLFLDNADLNYGQAYPRADSVLNLWATSGNAPSIMSTVGDLYEVVLVVHSGDITLGGLV